MYCKLFLVLLICVSCQASPAPIEEKIKALDAVSHDSDHEFEDMTCDPTRLDGCTNKLLQMVADDNTPIPTTIPQVETHCS